jgi:8-oxo-dGTP pyrophosphatase MutT (NUDIX family)
MESFAIPGAGGIIEKVIDNVTYILIQERLKVGSPKENGLIEIPAGKIRTFETIYDCLRREVKEETGLDVIEIEGERECLVHESNGYRVINYTPFSSTLNLQGTYPIMVQVFICRAAGELMGRSDESKNMRWVALDELERLIERNEDSFYPMHVITLKKYLKVKNSNKGICSES